MFWPNAWFQRIGVHVVLLNNCTILGQHTVLPPKIVVFKMQFGRILGNAIQSTEISLKLTSYVIFQIEPLLFLMISLLKPLIYLIIDKNRLPIFTFYNAPNPITVFDHFLLKQI